MIVIFDTETTTFPSPKLQHDDPNQARVVELAWLHLDSELNEVGCFSSLIKLEDQYSISEGAQQAHGISKEKTQQYGIESKFALFPFFAVASQCKWIVAHNIKFDAQLIEIEAANLGYDLPPRNNHICTMELMTPICRLPFKNGRRNYGNQEFKWPNLQEAHKHVTGTEFEKAHSALADVQATAKVLRFLVKEGYVKL